mgnify:CR=1 FL=1
MSICTSYLIEKHQSSAISDIKNSKTLPFSEVLTEQDLEHHLNKPKSRERVFTPEVTLWAFLSQVISHPQSGWLDGLEQPKGLPLVKVQIVI